MNTVKIGQEVVRAKGDYVVGRTGVVVSIDETRSRAQVQWHGETRTWVPFKVIESVDVPYEITKSARYPHRPQYRRLSAQIA